MWDFFLNKFMKISLPRPYSEDLWWRAIWMKEIPGYQVDEEAVVSRMASLEVRPYCRTRKHQWALFRSCVNWLVNLSSDEGDTNENITWKYKIILFVLLFSITLTRLTSTEIGRSYAEIKEIERKIRSHALMFSTTPWIWSFSLWCFAEDGNEMWQNLKHKCKTVVFAH